MFTIYPLALAQLISINALRAMRGKTAAERKDAGMTLLHMAIPFLAFSGTSGLMLSPVLLLINTASRLLEDEDDDPETHALWRNPDLAVYKSLSGILPPKFAEVISYGLPRAVGMDVATRITLANGVFQMADDPDLWPFLWGTTLKTITGPVFGGLPNDVTATFRAMNKGVPWYEAMWYVLPFKQGADIAKMRMEAERGLHTRSGTQLSDPMGYGVHSLGTGVGISSGKKALEGKIGRFVSQLEEEVKRRRSTLIGGWIAARKERRQGAYYNEEIRAYNKALPRELRHRRITQDDLQREYTRRRTQFKNRVGGVRQSSEDGRLLVRKYGTLSQQYQ
jgi:hypothetical protein